jgi:hypothetical protein
MPDRPQVTARSRIGVAIRTSRTQPVIGPPLPCMPCPHQSACCKYGTSLTPQEFKAIAREHGPHTVRVTEDDLRTAVDEHGCVFLADNACTLHAHEHYPATCQGFPWRDRDGGPYPYDVTICPELDPAGVACGDRG